MDLVDLMGGVRWVVYMGAAMKFIGVLGGV